MRLGLTSYAYPWSIGVAGHAVPQEPMDARALLVRASELRLGVVQLCDNLPMLGMDPGQCRELTEEAQSLGIKLELGGRGLTPDNLSQHLTLAHRIGVQLLRFVVDGAGYRPRLDEVATWLPPRLPELDAAGVTLAIENHDRFRASELAGFVRSMDSPRVGVCLDTANSLGAGEGFGAVFETLAPHTVNLHVKDIVAERFPHMQGLTVKGCPAGTGLLATELPEALSRLQGLGRCNSCLLESWVEPTADIVETRSREDAWVEEGVRWLKSLL